MLKLNDIFKLVREASGQKQTHIADKVGISHVALSRFEKGQSTLSTETLCSIAPYYFLNDDFIKGDNVNPFKSEGKLIKFFISPRIGLLPDLSLIQFKNRIKLILSDQVSPPTAFHSQSGKICCAG